MARWSGALRSSEDQPNQGSLTAEGRGARSRAWLMLALSMSSVTRPRGK